MRVEGEGGRAFNYHLFVNCLMFANELPDTCMHINARKLHSTIKASGVTAHYFYFETPSFHSLTCSFEWSLYGWTGRWKGLSYNATSLSSFMPSFFTNLASLKYYLLCKWRTSMFSTSPPARLCFPKDPELYIFIYLKTHSRFKSWNTLAFFLHALCRPCTHWYLINFCE